MSTIFIVLLRNNHIIFSEKQPKKRGNYTHDVRLFKAKASIQAKDIHEWCQNDHNSSEVLEVTDWD